MPVEAIQAIVPPPAPIVGLPPVHIGGLSLDQIGGLSQDQIGGLSRDGIGGLSQEQIGWVEALYAGSAWYAARVRKAYEDGTFDGIYDEDNVEERMGRYGDTDQLLMDLRAVCDPERD